MPAQELGFHTAWVNRPSLLTNTGLAPEASVTPEITADSTTDVLSFLAWGDRLPAGKRVGICTSSGGAGSTVISFSRARIWAIG